MLAARMEELLDCPVLRSKNGGENTETQPREHSPRDVVPAHLLAERSRYPLEIVLVAHGPAWFECSRPLVSIECWLKVRRMYHKVLEG